MTFGRAPEVVFLRGKFYTKALKLHAKLADSSLYEHENKIKYVSRANNLRCKHRGVQIKLNTL